MSALAAGAVAIRLEHILVAVALVLGLVGGFFLARSRLGRRAPAEPDAVHHILLPFTGTEISRRAVDAALRLARAEGATLMPAYLAAVPKSLPLDCAIPVEADQAMAMLEAIEQRAGGMGVPVDARIERGRTYRHALARLLAEEDFDRVVVSPGATGTQGLSGDDLVWLLERAPAEVMILRPGPEDHRLVVPAVAPGWNGDGTGVAAGGGRVWGGRPPGGRDGAGAGAADALPTHVAAVVGRASAAARGACGEGTGASGPRARPHPRPPSGHLRERTPDGRAVD